MAPCSPAVHHILAQKMKGTLRVIPSGADIYLWWKKLNSDGDNNQAEMMSHSQLSKFLNEKKLMVSQRLAKTAQPLRKSEEAKPPVEARKAPLHNSGNKAGSKRKPDLKSKEEKVKQVKKLDQAVEGGKEKKWMTPKADRVAKHSFSDAINSQQQESDNQLSIMDGEMPNRVGIFKNLKTFIEIQKTMKSSGKMGKSDESILDNRSLVSRESDF